MANQELASCVFLSACIIEKDYFYFSTRLDALPSDEYFHARLSTYDQGAWNKHDREQQVVSVCVMRQTEAESTRAYCALELASGMIEVCRPGGKITVEQLPIESTGGQMTQLTQIDGILYACGSAGAVFKRTPGGWITFNEGLNNKNYDSYIKEGYSSSDAISMTLSEMSYMNSIAGINGQLFIAGKDGLIFHRDGDRWRPVESPSNAWLERIKCIDENTVYILAGSGTILKGNAKGFKAIQTGVNDDFRCLEWFNGQLYVGGYKGIYVLEGEKLHRIDTKQKGDYECVAMDAYDGQLLAVSERWFLVFDGKDWKRIDHPDNEEILKQ